MKELRLSCNSKENNSIIRNKKDQLGLKTFNLRSSIKSQLKNLMMGKS